MKLLATLLALIILTISCIPCSDAADVLCRSTELTAGQQDKEHPADTHDDLCSPFCQCACCTVACTLPAAFNTITFSLALISEKQPDLYQAQDPADVALPVWQPPQLV